MSDPTWSGGVTRTGAVIVTAVSSAAGLFFSDAGSSSWTEELSPPKIKIVMIVAYAGITR